MKKFETGNSEIRTCARARTTTRAFTHSVKINFIEIFVTKIIRLNCMDLITFVVVVVVGCCSKSGHEGNELLYHFYLLTKRAHTYTHTYTRRNFFT